MNKEQIIEEMAIVLSKVNCKPEGCGYCYLEYGTLENSCEEYLVYKKMATALYNTEYQKERRGEWIERQMYVEWAEDDCEIFYECSQCNITTPFTSPYCPHCGAKMRGE